jgi:hypothetical protein
VAGPDGNLWFTDTGTKAAIGKVALQLAPAATTGAATAVTSSSATVSGLVNPLAAATSVVFRYGTTPAYGSTVAAGSLAASGKRSTVIAALAGLPPGSVVYYQVVATNAFGTTSGEGRTFTTVAVAPTITGARQSHRRWRLGSKLATLSKARRPPIGTTFSFTLNEQAQVSLVFKQKRRGREINGKCVAETKHNRHKRACERTVTPGSLAFNAQAGTDRVSFQGRISRSKKLTPGRYRLVISAVNTAGQRSKPDTLSFTIVK